MDEKEAEALPVMGTIFLVIGERAKRARHSHVCSIENRGYIYILLYILWYVQFLFL